MSLLQRLSKSTLGFGGKKPVFNAESKTSTLHYQSSTIDDPKILRNPSILDEQDALNTNKYRSSNGGKYTDQIFE